MVNGDAERETLFYVVKIVRKGAGATKTRSRYVSLAAVLSLQERIVCKRLTVTITALLRAKDRRLPSVFVAPAPLRTIRFTFSKSFAVI